MDDKTLIDIYTQKSIAGTKEEKLEKLWEPGDHMYRGEFVSPRRPETYFASDAEVDAYREALARMDGTIDAPASVPPVAAAPSAPVQEQPSAERSPFIEALSGAAPSTASANYRSVERDDDDDDDDDDKRDGRKYDNDDDDDDDRKSYDKRDNDDDDDDDDNERRSHREDDD